MKKILLWVLMIMPAMSFAAEWVSDELGEVATFSMESAPFPHESRANGHKYGDQVFSVEEHYSDSSVALIIPKDYTPQEKTDLVFYFHGWGNNIAKATEEFHLREMLNESGKNVILVFPEGPKNASDSRLGKIEDENGMKNLVDEVMKTLGAEGKTPNADVGKVILSGHSGAYRGIAHAMYHGGIEDHLSEVFLLDASYGNLDYIADWAVNNKTGKLRSIFTEHLREENQTIMNDLVGKSTAFAFVSDSELDDKVLQENRNVFVFTTVRDHNQSVERFAIFLKNSGLDDK